MSVTSLSILVPSVLEKLPASCAPDVITRALKDAARLVCIETEAYRPKLEVDTVAAQRIYTLTLPTDTVVKRVERAWLRTADEVTDGLQGSEIDLSSALFDAATSKLDFGFELTQEAITDGLVIELILVPTFRASEEITQWLMDLWAEAFVFKAVSDLTSRRGTPYFDAEVSSYFRAQYGAFKAQAMRGACDGQVGGSFVIKKGWSI